MTEPLLRQWGPSELREWALCQVDSAEEVTALVWPYKAVVPVEAGLPQLESPGL